jgi:hypothetical protein
MLHRVKSRVASRVGYRFMTPSDLDFEVAERFRLLIFGFWLLISGFCRPNIA